jgi:hypothetical protein
MIIIKSPTRNSKIKVNMNDRVGKASFPPFCSGASANGTAN